MLGSALRQRATTAALLIPLAIAAVLWLPTPLLALCCGAVVLLGAWEWAGLAGVTSKQNRGRYLVVVAAALGAAWLALLAELHVWLLAVISVWWSGVAVMLARVRVIVRREGVAWPVLATGLIVLPGPWLALIHLHGIEQHGPMLALFSIALISIADSAAYFNGRRWGHAKLAPVLSPGKTWAGAYGALAGAVLCGLFLAWSLDLPLAQGVITLLICTLSVAMSIVGDLYESFLKRRRGLKDAGQLLPGHGGVLDRIDSLTAAAPFFALGLILLGIGM